MGRDPFHQPRVLKAPSSLALNSAREWAATAPLGSLGQGLNTLRVKNFFLTPNLNLPSFSLKPSPLVLASHALAKSPSPALLQAPSGTGKAVIRCPQSLLCSLLNSPSSLGLSSQQRGSSPWIVAVALLWTDKSF